MADSAQMIPQIVPSSRCFSCDVCCRFPEKESFLRPFFTREEIRAAVATGISPEFFPDPGGCQIELVPNPAPQSEGYICPCFNPQNGHCRIYSVRPMDCQLYPVALMRDDQGAEVVVGLDTKCPYVTEADPGKHLSEYLSKVAAVLGAEPARERIAANPGLIQPHQEDVVYMIAVAGLAWSLKQRERW